MGDPLEDTYTVYYRVADPQPLTLLPPPYASLNNNRSGRNLFSKLNVALMFAVAFFTILSTVFAVMYFTCGKKDKPSLANSSNVGDVEKGEGMDGTSMDGTSMDGTIEQECKDDNTDCVGWARIGECATNPVWMEVNCKKSCDVCANSSNVGNVEKCKGMNGTIEQKSNGSSGSWKYVGYGCVGAKDSQYLELTCSGPSVCIGAVKLVHTNGSVGNNPFHNSNWGGPEDDHHDLAMIVTDLNNRVIYPSPRLVTVHNGWYKLPGYGSTSPELVLSDLRNPNSLKKGGKIRIWYGEDLKDYTEDNNHGKTCMWVYVFYFA